jgi:hypothetical protein
LRNVDVNKVRLFLLAAALLALIFDGAATT